MQKRDQAMQLLRECVEEYGEQTGGSYDLQDNTPLIGPDSPVDSLGLVMIITAFEAKLNETFNAELVLASEKAMSMSKSPFRSLGTLADYAVELLDEAGVNT
jgi:acyl carrier protein